MAFRPFQVQFDRATYGAVKAMAQELEITLTDTVIMCVRVAWSLIRNKDQYLTEEGRAASRAIADSFKHPIGVDK